jgi:hypothetical protein
MTNDECLVTKDDARERSSSFVLPYSLDIRH